MVREEALVLLLGCAYFATMSEPLIYASICSFLSTLGRRSLLGRTKFVKGERSLVRSLEMLKSVKFPGASGKTQRNETRYVHLPSFNFLPLVCESIHSRHRVLHHVIADRTVELARYLKFGASHWRSRLV